MRYSAFEQAAVEANIGMKELDAQIERVAAQVEQLKAKKDLLQTLSYQLSTLRPQDVQAATAEAAMQAAPAEAPAPEQPSNYVPPEHDTDLAGASSAPRSLRSEWFNRPEGGAPANGNGNASSRKFI